MYYLKTLKFRVIVLIGFLLSCFAMEAQVAKAFTIRDQRTIKGDMTMIANGIVNRDNGNGERPKDNYDGNRNNNDFSGKMRYINVDGASSSDIFSSSKATLTVPDIACSKVVYAALYWSGMYKYTGAADFNTVKLKLPNAAAYIDITGETIFDDHAEGFFDNDTPYVCYANVTSYLAGLTGVNGANGEYIVANVRATEGNIEGGVAAGWTLYVVYENPTMPGKYITSYDGLGGIKKAPPGGNSDVYINYSGFISVPLPQTVKAKLIVSALEGDKGLDGDSLEFKGGSGNFSTLSNNRNPSNNFFNSSISVLETTPGPTFGNSINFANRVPNSINTLGYDSDIIDISALLPNGATTASLKMKTTQDAYYMFFNALSVDVIEPKIQIVKTVKKGNDDAAGVDVLLNDELDYILTFNNTGNDDAKDLVISDILPKNTTYVSSTVSNNTITGPVVNPVTKALEYTIPNNLVLKGTSTAPSPLRTIKIKVRVTSNCLDLVDACSNVIRNSAFATYRGVQNNNLITNNPSITKVGSCGEPIVGPANFIVDIANCDFTHNEVLCSGSKILTAGNGYASYQWYRKDAAGDVLLTGETGQQMTVTSPGEYYVKCEPAAPCFTRLTEKFVVTAYGPVLANPVKPFQTKEAKCNDTGEIIPIIVLCGSNASKTIQSGVTGATSIVWEKLVEGSCPNLPVANCINKSTACTWVNVGNGPDYVANLDGTFRMKVSYDASSGCTTSFYFKVFKNDYDPKVKVKNIVCSINGEIRVIEVPDNYEFRLLDQYTGTVLVPYSTNPVFPITTAGTYKVELKQLGVGDGCIFEVRNIVVEKKELTVAAYPQNITCNIKGSITVQPSDVQVEQGVPEQYIYKLDGPVSLSPAPTTDNNKLFDNLLPGVYTVTVTTAHGCSFPPITVTIHDYSKPSVTALVTQNISCVPGTIKLTGTGGEPVYLYAIHSYNGALIDPNLVAFSDVSLIEIPEGQEGTYVFIMKDANGCTSLSSPVTISVMPGVVYGTASTNLTCNGVSNGTITYTVTASNGYSISYELLDAGGNVIKTNTTGKFTGLAAGTYTVNLIQTGIGNVPCPFPTEFILTEPSALTGTASLTQAFTCATTGTIAVNVPSVTGGIAPYEYSIGGAFSGTPTFTGLTPGTYTVTVKDANDCTHTMPAIIIPVLPKMTDLDFTQTAVTCPTEKANVTVAAVGGAAPYQYAITAPATAVTPIGASATFTALAPGTYTFTVTDANSCTFSEDYTINAITKINVTGQLVKNVVCFSEANGSIKYTVNGSTNYNYSVVSTGTPVASATNQSASVINLNSLLAGTYAITVKDNVTNCESTDTVIIAAPTAALTVSHSVVEPTCTAPGSITVTAANGWGNYKYQLNAGTVQSSNVFNNVAAGTYTITVIDANGCVKTDTATLTTPSAPVIDITGSDLCFDADGTSITVNTTGGRAPFTYTLNGGAGQTEATFDGLVPGNYTITVKDGNNCVTPGLNFTVYPALKLDVTQKELDCSPSPDAQINITITDGKAPYTYETKIGSNPYGSSASVATNTINYSTVAAGTFTFKITDALGCSIETNTIEVLPLSMPAITSVTPTSVVCHGESNGSIAVVVNTAVGTPAYTITVENTTTGEHFTRTTNLPAGNYIVTVTDGKGCIATENTEIKQPNAITFTTVETPIKCTPHPTDPTLSITAGKIRIENVAGGFQPVTGTDGPYTYYIKNNFAYEPLPVTTSDNFYEFIILNFGIYEVTVEDANGCKLVKSNIVMASPPEEMDIDIATTIPDCATGGTAVVEVKPIVSSNNYSFAILTTNNPNSVPASDYKPADPGTPTIHTFNGLTPGLTYTFIVKDNATGCYYIKEATASIPTLSNLAIAKDIVSNVTCTNADDGTAKFTFTGFDAGATAISYEVYYAQSNLPVTTVVPPALPPSVPVAAGEVSVSGLAPGVYFILFKEIGGLHDGCSVVSETFTISESLKLLVPSATITKNDNCNTKAGIITAGANHGTAPYSYELKLSTDTPPTVTTWAGTAVNTFNADGGNYIVYVKDANNCIKPIAITLPTDPSPIIAATLTNQCNTAEGAFSIEVNMTQAGMSPYTYSIDGGPFVSQATMPFTYTNLSSGDHTVTVKDVNGCTFTPAIPTKVFTPLDLTTSVTAQPWCGVANGEIKVTGFGGSGAYRYELRNASNGLIAGPQILNTFGGMIPATYKVIIRDFNTGCFKEGSITLETPTPVTFSTTQENVKCKGGNDGSITILLPASNNNPSYTYLVSKGGSSILQSGPIFTGLTEGVYDIKVLSGRVCDATGSVTITAPNAVTATATATPFACNPDNTVKTSLVTITATGGVGTYWYSINNGVDYFETNTFDVVDNGATQNLTVYVKDTNNCEFTLPVVINALPALGTATATQVTGITCTNDETVKIDVTGGSGNFKFELLPAGASVSPAAGIRTANFTLTAVGNYTFKVTDITTGCSIITAPYEILPYNTITATVSNAVPVVCFGASDGKITLNVANYTGTYSYKVFDDLGTEVATGTSTAPNNLVIPGLPAGLLHVEVKATGTPFCTVTTTTITVTSPAGALVLNATPNTSVTCDNDKGAITALATGGWGTYEYEFTNTTTSTLVQAYGSNNEWTGLAAGTYTIKAKDAGGCEVTTTVTLNPAVRIVAGILATPTLLACHGDANATVKATGVANGEGVYQYILNTYDTAGTLLLSSGAQLTDTFTGLGAGIYSITVTDGWNCFVETTKVTVSQPNMLQGALSIVKNIECTTGAQFELEVTGGTGPYSYRKDGDIVYTPMATNPVTISNIAVGTYKYEIIDANGCATVMSNEMIIEPVEPLDLNITKTKVNCFGGATAQISANATGGLGSYKYALLGDASGTIVLVADQDSGTFAGLGEGSYYVRVKSIDCVETSAEIIIADPDELKVTPHFTHVKCNGETTGKIELEATGGTGTIQYAISPDLSLFDDNNIFEGLKAGLYTVLVQDANGCFKLLVDLKITEPELVTATIDMTGTSGERCLGANDGNIAIDIRGGMGPYLVSITDTAGAITPTEPYIPMAVGETHYVFDYLVPGDKTIFIKDSNGCAVDPPLEYTITEGIDMIPTTQVTQVCTGNVPSSTLVINIDSAITATDVEYSIDGTNYQALNTFTNVAPGVDKIAYAKHVNGCIQKALYTVETLTPIVATAPPTAVLCNAGTTGKITVIASGGTGTLEYAISDAVPPVFGAYGTDNVFTGLVKGTYAVSVKDSIGCQIEITNILVTEPALALSATAVPTDEICINANDGTIEVTPVGGTAPYYVTLNGGTEVEVLLGASYTFIGLADADYTIDVRDTNNCAITQQTVTINAGVDIQAVATPVETCTGNVPSTEVTVTVNAAVLADVEYSFDGAAYGASNTFTYANTAGGPKTVDVKHTNGCVQSLTFDINNLTSITATAATTQDVLCNAGTTGEVTVTATDGTGTLTYAISSAVPPVFTAYDTNNVFTGLTAGTYTVSVKDGIGCEVVIPGVIVDEPALALSATAVPTDEICINANDGTIEVTPVGGTAPYYVTLNGGTEVEVLLGASHTFIGLADADYTIDVRDTNNCAITQQTVTINAGVDIQAVATPVETCTGNLPSTVVTVTVNAAVAADVQYSFDGAAYSTVNTFTYANTAGGPKTVDVKHTNGCVQSLTFDINNLTPIAATAATTQDVLCNAGTTGEVTVTATDGTGTLTYAISSAVPPVFTAYDTNNVFTGLTAGTYTVSVKDGIGCEVVIPGVIVDEPALALSATAVPTDEICINANNGTIEVTPVGGTAPYYVTLNGGTEVEVLLGASHTFIGLADADYTIDVRDTNNCTITQQTITINPGVDLQVVATVVETCTGNVPSSEVTITVNAALAADVQYSFDGGTFGTSNTFTYANTAGGLKTVGVQHINGCIERVTYTINNLTPITATAATTQDVLCHAGTTGEVTVTATDGTGTLEYAISSAIPPVFTAYDTNNVFTGLTAGTYTVSVKDGIGCEVIVTGIIVNEPAQVLSATAVATHEICINANDGTIEVTPVGGTAPYYVTLNGGTEVEVLLGASHTFIGLADADYTIDVRDTNNCAITQQTVTINAGVDIQAVATPVETCTGNVPSTVVTVLVNAALAADVQYSFDGAAYGASNTFTYANTAGGPKTVDVKHTNGCVQSLTFDINNLTPITATAATTQDVLCHAGTTGEVTVTATDGTGTLEYAISSAVPPVFTAYDTNNIFTGLTAGTYTVSVKDGIGCEVIVTGVIVNEPAQVLSATAVATHEICINANDGTIEVTPIGGTAPYYVTLNGGAEVEVLLGASHTFIGLADADYTIDVRDTNNCAITQQTVTINPGVDIQGVATVVETCTGNVPSSVVTVSVNGAVAADVQYSFGGGTYSASNTFTYANTAGGTKTVDVKHTNGCVQSLTFDINNLTPITATAATTQDVLCHAGTTGEVTVTATDGTGTLEYAISSAVPPVFATYTTNNVFTGLTAGTYTVSVKDGIGCEVIITGVIVNEPAQALTATAVPTHEICIGAGDGTITITPSGGTAPYFTSIDGVTYVQDKVLYDNLAAGMYTIAVKDANDCAITQQTVTINPGVDIQAVATVVETCTGNVPSSVVTITVNAAVAADVQYSFDGGTYSASNTFTYANTAGGPKTVDVKHANGCIQPLPFTINNLTPIGGTATATANVLCFGNTTGEVTVTATGGTGALEYAISSATPPVFGTYQASNVFTGLTAGTYTVSVKDAIGCEFVINTILVDGPTAAIAATAVGTPETCINVNDGTITITPSGGTAPYFTSIDGVAYTQDKVLYDNLADGTYTVYVKDANNCAITPLTVTIIPGVAIQPTVTVSRVCDVSTVTISVNPAVAGNVTYYIDSVLASNSETKVFTPGVHTVDVEHVNGCIESTTFTIAPIVPITIGTPILNDIACYGMSTGTIEVIATGGNGALQYALYHLSDYQNGGPALYPYSTSNTFVVPAGFYVAKVRDAIGCEVISQNMEIKEPLTPLSATVTTAPETCVLAKDGKVIISNISGGTPPYSIALNTQTENNFIQIQGNSHEFTGLFGGIYDVFIRDSKGCYLPKFTRTVKNGVNIQPYVATAVSCNNNIQTTTVTVQVIGTPINEVTFSETGNAGTFTTNNVFSYTTPGDYVVYVLHVNGCKASVKFTVAPRIPIVPVATAVAVLCKGEANGSIKVSATGGIGALQYGIAPNYNMTSNPVFNGLTAGDHIVRVQDTAGCYTDITVKVEEPATALVVQLEKIWQEEICADDNNGALEVNVTGGTAPYFTSLSANGVFTEGEYLFDNLDGGVTYTVYVKDANGCTASIDVPLAAPINIDAKADVAYGCDGNNTITVTTSDVFVPTDLTHTISGAKGGTPQTSNIFTNLADGEYTVEVLHASGCSDSVTFKINNPLPLTVTLAETGFNQITATASGGSGSHSYSITFNGEEVTTHRSHTYFKSGTYVVTVTDSRGCEAKASIDVVFVEINIPDIVTPDNDGHNDGWKPNNTQNYPKLTAEVFDRYGRKLATLKEGQAWDCRYEGNEMPSGDYWYLVKLNADQDSREFIGHFTIYR